MPQPTKEQIREKMNKISEAIDASLSTKFESDELGPIINILTYEQQNAGKRLRPALASMISDTLGGDFKTTIDIATACELLHSASLMLDDAIDEDPIRRGKPAIHKAFGGGMTLMGTYVLALLGLEIGITKSNELGKLLVETLRRLVVGSSAELTWAEWDQNDYLNIVSNKTAALFEAPCQIGAITANRPEYRDVAKIYGNHLGMLYQLTDDYVDVAKSIKLNEPVGDIKNRITTIPIIHTYKHTGKSEIKYLLEMYRKKVSLPDEYLRMIIYEIDQCKSLEYLSGLITDLRATAVDDALKFPLNTHRDYLLAMPQFMIDSQLEEIDMPSFKE